MDALSEFFRSLFYGEFTHADEHAHLAVESYCGHLPLGKSYFCDFVWRLWDTNVVQTIFWSMTFFVTSAIGALVIGYMEYQKKIAFEATTSIAVKK